MKKIVVKLDLHDDRGKQKAIKAVSSLLGIDSITMDMKEQKLTVIGDVDPVDVVSKLRKCWHTDVVSVGPPPKEPEKKKEEPKKDEKKKDSNDHFADCFIAHQKRNFCMPPPPYYHHLYNSMEENPNACVIC